MRLVEKNQPEHQRRERGWAVEARIHGFWVYVLMFRNIINLADEAIMLKKFNLPNSGPNLAKWHQNVHSGAVSACLVQYCQFSKELKGFQCKMYLEYEKIISVLCEFPTKVLPYVCTRGALERSAQTSKMIPSRISHTLASFARRHFHLPMKKCRYRKNWSS